MENIIKVGNKKLDLINKMAILRNGYVPVPIVVLKGHKKNVEVVAKKEKDILKDYFTVLKEGCEVKPGAINFVPCDIEVSNISWLKERFEEIDVDSISMFDWDEFLNKLGLTGASADMFKDFSNKMLENLAQNEDQIITDVLYSHYTYRDNNEITQNDIKNIRRKCQFGATSKPDTKPDIKAPASQENSFVETGADVNIADTNKSSINEDVPNLESTNDTQTVKEPEESKETNENEDEDIIPKPKEQQQKKPNLIVKEELTEDEERNNKRLLEDLRDLYKTTIIYINETCNSQYRGILNKMQEAVDKNVYKQQFTKMYLDISEDTSSELYRRLYDVDIATQKFHKSVVHQIKHLGCFNCGTNWDEDITFLVKGPHKVHCPKCFNDYPFEK